MSMSVTCSMKALRNEECHKVQSCTYIGVDAPMMSLTPILLNGQLNITEALCLCY